MFVNLLIFELLIKQKHWALKCVASSCTDVLATRPLFSLTNCSWWQRESVCGLLYRDCSVTDTWETTSVQLWWVLTDGVCWVMACVDWWRVLIDGVCRVLSVQWWRVLTVDECVCVIHQCQCLRVSSNLSLLASLIYVLVEQQLT